MKVIAPLKINDGIMASNVPEDDAPVWAIGTAYAKDAEVIKGHVIYVATVSNTGNDPATDDGTNWIEFSATNRWRAFDGKVSNLVTATGSMVYEFTAPTNFISGVGLMNAGAAVVRVEVFDNVDNLIYSKEISRFANTAIVDYWTFYTVDLALEDVPDTIFDDVLGFPDNRIVVTLEGINPSSEVTLGQLVIGKAYDLGTTLDGTGIGFKDFSSKERDQFGNAVILERPFADTINFQFTLRTSDARRVRSVLASLRATPALYYADTSILSYGTQAYGFFQDFELPLSAGGQSFANLKIEGLT